MTHDVINKHLAHVAELERELIEYNLKIGAVKSDLADARNEIARLRELVESAYFEGACDAIDFGITQTRLGWNDSHAKAALDEQALASGKDGDA